jgi:hypothetical protein
MAGSMPMGGSGATSGGGSGGTVVEAEGGSAGSAGSAGSSNSAGGGAGESGGGSSSGGAEAGASSGGAGEPLECRIRDNGLGNARDPCGCPCCWAKDCLNTDELCCVGFCKGADEGRGCCAQ